MSEKKPFPSQIQDRFIIRMPDGLRDRIKDAAAANARSMNAEIVHALETIFPPVPSGHFLMEAIEENLELALALKGKPGARAVREELIEQLRDYADLLREELERRTPKGEK